MSKVKIFLINGNIVTISNNDKNFVDLVSEIFKKKFYISMSADDSPNVALNTNNITDILEIKNA